MGDAITKLIALKTMRVKSTTQLVTFITTLWNASFLTVMWDQHGRKILEVFGNDDCLSYEDAVFLTEVIDEFMRRR